MIFKRPNIVCKLECINKFSVVVHYQFEKHFFFKKFSFPFYEGPLFGNSSHFIGVFASSHADHLGKSYVLLTKVWAESIDS